MAVITWIIFGGLIGWIAAILADKQKKEALLQNISFGVLGALIGGFAMNAMGIRSDESLSPLALCVACGGAVLALYVRSLIRSTKKTS